MTDLVQTQTVAQAPEPAVVGGPLVPRGKWSLDSPIHKPTALAYCEAIAFGRTLLDIERDANMPPKDLFLLWVMKDPEVALAFSRARELSSYALEDDALHILRERMKSPGTSVELRAVDLLVQQIRWSVAKRNPQVFSDKAAANITVPIQINTTLDMGGASLAASTKEFPNIYELQATTVPDGEPSEPSGEDGEVRQAQPADTYAGVRDTSVPAAGKRKLFGPGPRKRILKPKGRAAMTLAEREAAVAARIELMKQKAATLSARMQRRKDRREARRNGSDPQD